jgi:wee1-like protein kinase
VKVRHRVDSVKYAIKIVSVNATGAERRRVMQEVQALAQLKSSAHLLRYYSAWEEDQKVYIVTELCHGSLRQLSRSHLSGTCDFCSLSGNLSSSQHR